MLIPHKYVKDNKGDKMIRIRSPTKKKLNSKISAIGKILSGRFFNEMKGEFKKMKQEMININAPTYWRNLLSNFEKERRNGRSCQIYACKKYGKNWGISTVQLMEKR